jgi:hypothetical protein
VAREFLENRRNLWSASRELASLNSAGHEWVPLVFVSIASQLDNIPAPGLWWRWDENALRTLLTESADWLGRAHADAREAAQQMLEFSVDQELKR